jgi:hypothetical protein
MMRTQHPLMYLTTHTSSQHRTRTHSPESYSLTCGHAKCGQEQRSTRAHFTGLRFAGGAPRSSIAAAKERREAGTGAYEVDSVEDQRGHVNQKQMCERSLVPTTRMVVKTIAPFHINQELFVTEYRLLRVCCAVLCARACAAVQVCARACRCAVCRCVCSCAADGCENNRTLSHQSGAVCNGVSPAA